MVDTQNSSVPAKKDARWPFVLLYAFMWAGMIMTTLNRDPIKFGFSIGVVLGLLAIVCIVAWLAHGRIRQHSVFSFEYYPSVPHLRDDSHRAANQSYRRHETG